MNDNVLIRVKGLHKHFAGHTVRALDGVDATIERGEVVVKIEGSIKSILTLLASQEGAKYLVTVHYYRLLAK